MRCTAVNVVVRMLASRIGSTYLCQFRSTRYDKCSNIVDEIPPATIESLAAVRVFVECHGGDAEESSASATLLNDS